MGGTVSIPPDAPACPFNFPGIVPPRAGTQIPRCHDVRALLPAPTISPAIGVAARAPGCHVHADFLELSGRADPDPVKALLPEGVGHFVGAGDEHQIVANCDAPVAPAKVGVQQSDKHAAEIFLPRRTHLRGARDGLSVGSRRMGRNERVRCTPLCRPASPHGPFATPRGAPEMLLRGDHLSVRRRAGLPHR